MSIKNIALSLVFATSIIGTCYSVDRNATDILENRITSTNKRYNTFIYAFQLMKERKVKTIVETGVARSGGTFEGDGGSTILFADFAQHHGALVYSVDIDPSAIENARELVGTSDVVKLTQGDSVDYLKKFHGTIDFLYLDSFDYDAENPTPSQMHHLKEITAAYPHLKRKSIVMIDDCDLPNGGKGILAIKFLQKRGWKIAKQGYQTILVRK